MKHETCMHAVSVTEKAIVVTEITKQSIDTPNAVAELTCNLCGSYCWRFRDLRLGAWHPPATMPFPIQNDVTAFHRTMDQPIGGPVPAVPPDDRVRLRLRLIAEEFFESFAACTASPETLKQLSDIEHLTMDLIRTTTLFVDLPALVDGLCDLDYVVEGTRVEIGVVGAAVHAEVQRANMAKAAVPAAPTERS